jgi:hypothetical protein
VDYERTETTLHIKTKKEVEVKPTGGLRGEIERRCKDAGSE